MKSMKRIQQRVQALHALLAEQHGSWMCLLEEGQEIPDELVRVLGPNDSLLIQGIPVGYFGECAEPTFYRMDAPL